MLIVRREYLERVRTKSFIITTLLMPILMIGLMAAPSLIMFFGDNKQMDIAVIDNSEVIVPELESTADLRFTPVTISADSAKNDARFDAVMVIGSDIMNDNSDIKFFTHESIGMTTEEAITDQVEDIIENYRLQAYNIHNLSEIMDEVKASCMLNTVRIGDEESAQTSGAISYALGMFMTFILYMFIILYGQMVMTSIIEEKNNRVLEVVVSSVKPTTLMCGKVIGIGCVAATQILIWAVLVCSFVMWVMPLLLSNVTAGASPEEGAEIGAMLGVLGDPGYIMSLFGWMTLFLIGGYLFYCGIYAAIGSAVDNIQDASQLQSLALMPVILAFVLSFTCINDPNSGLAVTLSMIPFTSPLVMVTRLPYGVPVWQPVVSLLLLAAGVVFMLWFAAKVYRVGIFMYGKKPSIKELIRWATYK